MIHLTKGQSVPENSNLRVFSATGDYEDDALIECYDVAKPSFAVNCFQAQFIKYGNMVYRYNMQEELGEAIVQVDPASTHDSAYLFLEEKDRKERRGKGKLRPENPAKMKMEPAKKIEEEVPVEETEPMVTEPETEPVTEPIIDTTATSTDPVSQTDSNQLGTSTASTTNATSTPNGTSTSTPNLNFDTSTTTPSFDTSTSTTTPVDSATSTPVDISTSTPDFDFGTSTTTPTSAAATEVSSSTSDNTASVLDAVDDLISNTTSTPVIEPSIQEATSTISDVVALAKKVARRRIK